MPATPSANVAGLGSSVIAGHLLAGQDAVAERGGEARVRTEVEAVGDHAVVRGVQHAGRQRFGRAGGEVGADRHRAGAVAIGDLDLGADALDPRGAPRPGDSRDHDRRSPVGGGALHHARATGRGSRSARRSASSAVRVPSRRRAGAPRSRPRTRRASRGAGRSPASRARRTSRRRSPRRPTSRARRPRGRRAPARAAARSRGGARRSRPSARCGRAWPGPGPSGTRCRAGARSPRLRPRRARVRAFGRVAANGFSQITCLPAAIAASAQLGVGVRRSGDRDRVDAVERERVVERGERVRHAEEPRALARPVGVAPDDGHARRSRRRAARARA